MDGTPSTTSSRAGSSFPGRCACANYAATRRITSFSCSSERTRFRIGKVLAMTPPAAASSPSRRTAALPTPEGRQVDVVYLNANRDQVVLGTAGSGKTTMAILRAAYLSHPGTAHGGATLLVTFNKALAAYITALGAATTHRVDIRNYHRVARGYLNSRNLMHGAAILGNRKPVVRAAVRDLVDAGETSRFLTRPIEFFLDELAWIAGNDIPDAAAYATVERIGRRRPLRARQRHLMWQIRDRYLQRRNDLGHWYDWDDIATAMLTALEEDSTPRKYRHVVVDEAQDLSPLALRSLKALLQPGGTMTLFADYAQQIYGPRTSYRQCGITITQAELFQENYRNSPGIAQLAIATASLPHFRDDPDLVAPTSPLATGTPPTLYRASSFTDELTVIRSRALELSHGGTVAVLAPTWASAQRALGDLPHTLLRNNTRWTARTGIYAGTYFSAKGLEFDTVILPFLGANKMPRADQIDAFGASEAKEREAGLIYVGITRARSELLVTYQDELTELLPAPDSGLWISQ